MNKKLPFGYWNVAGVLLLIILFGLVWSTTNEPHRDIFSSVGLYLFLPVIITAGSFALFGNKIGFVSGLKIISYMVSWPLVLVGYEFFGNGGGENPLIGMGMAILPLATLIAFFAGFTKIDK